MELVQGQVAPSHETWVRGSTAPRVGPRAVRNVTTLTELPICTVSKQHNASFGTAAPAVAVEMIIL